MAKQQAGKEYDTKQTIVIVYNITTKVSWGIAEEWLQWQQAVYLPEIMATYLCTENKLFRLLDQDEEEGPTFTLQLFFPDQEKYAVFIREYAGLFSKKSTTRWGNQSIAFKTAMQLVN